jgi:hypothetical protein
MITEPQLQAVESKALEETEEDKAIVDKNQPVRDLAVDMQDKLVLNKFIMLFQPSDEQRGSMEFPRPRPRKSLVPVYVIGTLASNRDQLFRTLQTQIEFYFSRSNLRFDKYLRKQVLQDIDGFVSMSFILRFNRIRNITNDVDIIKESVQKSDHLILSSDGTHIKRKAALPDRRTMWNADRKIIFIDNIQVTDTLESIQQKFSSYGKLSFVRLPKFHRIPGKPRRGFAFVEFETREGFEKALESCKHATLGNAIEKIDPPKLELMLKLAEERRRMSTEKDKEFMHDIRRVNPPVPDPYAILSKQDYLVVKEILRR